MLKGVRSKHVEKLWAAFRAHGVEAISLHFKDCGEVRLTGKVHVVEFLLMLRGNDLDQLMGSWLMGMKELVKHRRPGPPSLDLPQPPSDDLKGNP